MKKILVVEDDPMLFEIYKKKFSEEGWDVKVATSGVEAEKIALKEKPTVVLLDLILPEEDGFEVLKKIKQSSVSKNMKVIVFSNLSQSEDQEKAQSLGADGFLIKSDYTPSEIVNKISELVGENEQNNSDSKQENQQLKNKSDLYGFKRRKI